MAQHPRTFRVRPKIHSFNKHLCKLGTENTNILNDEFMKVSHILRFLFTETFQSCVPTKNKMWLQFFFFSLITLKRVLGLLLLYTILNPLPHQKNPLPIKSQLTLVFPFFKSLIVQTTQLGFFPHLIYSGSTSNSVPVFFFHF